MVTVGFFWAFSCYISLCVSLQNATLWPNISSSLSCQTPLSSPSVLQSHSSHSPLLSFSLFDGHWVLRPVQRSKDMGRQRTPDIHQMVGAPLHLPVSLLLAKHKSLSLRGAPLHPLTPAVTPSIKSLIWCLLYFDCTFKKNFVQRLNLLISLWKSLFLCYFHKFPKVTSIHPSIFYTRLIQCRVGAYPSCHWARGPVHPGLVTSPSQGHIETNETHNHAHSLLGTIQSHWLISYTCFWTVGGSRSTKVTCQEKFMYKIIFTFSSFSVTHHFFLIL